MRTGRKANFDCTKRHSRSRIRLPHLWYRVNLPANDPLVTLIALDSNAKKHTTDRARVSFVDKAGRTPHIFERNRRGDVRIVSGSALTREANLPVPVSSAP